MTKKDQLINDFKRQDATTIWNYLDALAYNHDVYSEHVTGLGPELQRHNIYIYAHAANVVVVCLDDGVSDAELADEEDFNGDLPQYFTESGHRVSPVWQLEQALKAVRGRLRHYGLRRKVWGVLLTGSYFINSDDMLEVWEKMKITVIHNLTEISSKSIAVNSDEGIRSGVVLMKAIDDLVDRTELTAPDADKHPDIDKESKNLFDEGFREWMTRLTDDDSDDGGDDDGDETAEDDTDDVDDFLEQHFGIVEQNHNHSVKVRVLNPMDNPREELDKLVGCQDIKTRIDELLALTRYNQMVKEAFPNAKLHEVSLHSIFFGRPGTGKTTVCKIFGSLLHEAGALSKGHVVVADRSTFIGSLWGDEERSVSQVVEMAQGGVLMIDEAYLLNGKHDHDPGKMVIQLLMELLADESRRDIAVVLCGYKEPMMRLLDTNPGLHSRFPNRFEFNDFTVDELMEITRRRISEYQYSFTDQAWQKFHDVVTSAYNVRDPQSWGNARFVANQLESVYIQHAQRCIKERPADSKQLLMLTPADIKPIEVTRARPRIGF